MRRAFFVTIGLAVAAVLAAGRTPTSAAPDVTGNWLLTTSAGPGAESVVCILKVDEKDGKPAASVLFSPQNVENAVTDFRTTDSTVSFTLKQVRTFKGQEFTSELVFVGVRGKDAKLILGSTGDSRFRSRAKLTATDKEKLAPSELNVRAELPGPMAEALQLSAKVSQAQFKMFREKDAEKRKELQKDTAELAKEAAEKQPGLYREVVEKHAEAPVAFDAAVSLLRAAGRSKVEAAEAVKLVKLVQKHAEPYGPLFAGTVLVQVASNLTQAELGAAAVAAIEPVAKSLTEDLPADYQFDVLDTYKAALAASAKELEPRLAKLDAKLDAEYLKAVPPFKPAAFAGRRDANANRVAVLELFTGAQCPPCVAADVAFDGLLKTYKPADVVLVQYHVHIPGPDPLTAPDSTARFQYYQEEFPEAVRGAPSAVFNGKPQAGGGGAMSDGEAKFKAYADVITPILESATEVKVAGKATRTGDKLDIAVEVSGGAGEDMRLRLLVVEEEVKYVGGNRIRFHHHVVRAMPGGADGVAIKDKAFKHAAAVDFAEVRKELNKYLDDYAKTRPFPKAERPMDLKAVKVIALVQNDKTKEIVQAAQIEVAGKSAGE